MGLRQFAAVTAGKTAQQVSRLLHLGGGTSLPGMVAMGIAPHVLDHVAKELRSGVVLVTGTNGKTTTTRMLSGILRMAGFRLLHNRAGANLITGLTTTAITSTNLLGHPQADLALFETDEAHVPAAIRATNPRVILVLNLFRDQLDRYGEVDTITRRWRKAFQDLPSTATVILNADDPAVAGLGTGLNCKVLYFGLEDVAHGLGSARHIADSAFCSRCGTALDYHPPFFGHIGHWQCPTCGNRRPTTDIAIDRLKVHGTDSSQLIIREPRGGFDLLLPVPGLYNALNAVAAIATGVALDIAPSTMRNALETFSAAFGRIERIQVEGQEILLALIKNPIGASETIRMVVGAATLDQKLHLFVLINDKVADGTDVSWLWDADWEQLATVVEHVTVSGTRAGDMAVRIKYAGVPETAISYVQEVAAGFEVAMHHLPNGQTLYILPTYTAMLEIRKDLESRSHAKPFWAD
ncbi:MAG: MurT ligase domain-containing protein [Herpetosiphon sp.]